LFGPIVRIASLNLSAGRGCAPDPAMVLVVRLTVSADVGEQSGIAPRARARARRWLR
jgi:hypothetical protein